MTTSVIVLNHGPDSVSVAPIDDSGNTVESERQTIPPQGISRAVLVYANRNIHVAASKPLSPPL